MRVYLAGPSSEAMTHVRAVASELEEAGHEIVDKWWLRLVPGVSDDRLPDDALDASIGQCIETMNQRAEVLVALPRTTLNVTLSTGTAVEVGMALANGWPVIVLRRPERFPFRTRCRIVESVAAVLAELREIEHARWVEASDMASYRAGDADPVAPRERAVQLVAAPPSPSDSSAGVPDVVVEEPPPYPGRRPDASEEWRERWARERARVETLSAMVQRAAREIASTRFRADLLADLEATLKEP